MNWQPIKTAPLDGTVVLVWDRGLPIPALFEHGKWYDALNSEYLLKPSHWMPLLSPPKQK